MASQITGFFIVCSTVCSDADQRKHQSSASRAFVRGIHWWPVDSPHKRPVTRKSFPFDDVIMQLGIRTWHQWGPWWQVQSDPFFKRNFIRQKIDQCSEKVHKEFTKAIWYDYASGYCRQQSAQKNLPEFKWRLTQTFNTVLSNNCQVIFPFKVWKIRTPILEYVHLHRNWKSSHESILRLFWNKINVTKNKHNVHTTGLGACVIDLQYDTRIDRRIPIHLQDMIHKYILALPTLWQGHLGLSTSYW